MSGRVFMKCLLVLFIAVLVAAPASAQIFAGTFTGFHELGTNLAILTDGTGTIRLVLDRNAQTLTYTLTYSGLTSNVTQAHIHFGRNHNAGGVFVFFCTNLTPPAGVPVPPPCPVTGGTVTGTLRAADVIGLPGQHVSAGDFNALVRIITNNAGYANVHTQNFQAGEIRAEVRRVRRDDDGDHQ
jgi:hypothetical protein